MSYCLTVYVLGQILIVVMITIDKEKKKDQNRIIIREMATTKVLLLWMLGCRKT